SVLPLAMEAIDRAVTLDTSLAEAYASRATLLQASWRWADAERDYQHALRLDPNSAQSHQWYGELLLLNGRTADSQKELSAATGLDPLARIAFGSYGMSLAAGHANDAAIAAGRRAVELDSTLIVARFMLGATYLQAGKLPEALRELQVAQRLDSNSVQ